MSETFECKALSKNVLPIGLLHGTEAHSAFCALIDGHRVERRAGSIIKLEGEAADTVYYVLSGWLITSKSMVDGHRQILDLVLPGGVLDPSSADANTSALEIEPLTDTAFSAIPRDAWARLLKQHAGIGDAVTRATMAAISRMTERMLRLGKGTAESIIAFALCELWLRTTPQGLFDGGAFHIPMTQQQLGDLCGLSAVHICRTLRRLERANVLTVTNHMDIVVHDVNRLAAIAEIDAEALRKEIIPAA